MSAPAGHPSLRQRIATALSSHLDSHSNEAVGAVVGHAGSTICRRGADLGAWPSDELLLLATVSPEIAEALRVFIDGSALAGDPYAVERDASSAIADGAKAISEDNEALSDGRVDNGEAARIRMRLLAAKRAIEKRVANIEARLRQERA